MSKRAANPAFETADQHGIYINVFDTNAYMYFVLFHKFPTSLKFGNFTENFFNTISQFILIRSMPRVVTYTLELQTSVVGLAWIHGTLLTAVRVCCTNCRKEKDSENLI